jgi:hypothetical protein
MRACVVELDNNKLRYVMFYAYTIVPDKEYEGKYAATRIGQSMTESNLTKLTDNTYRDNYGSYFLTEEHPMFNAYILSRTAVRSRLDDNFLISHLLEGVRYLVKQSLLKASSLYNK